MDQDHFLRFPCAVDAMYAAMDDPGFTPLTVQQQMLLCAFVPCLWPVYGLCCTMQALVLRDKIDALVLHDFSPFDCVYACVCPWCLTAQMHRELEVRGNRVHLVGSAFAYVPPSMPGTWLSANLKDNAENETTFQLLQGGESETNTDLMIQERRTTVRKLISSRCCCDAVRYNSPYHCVTRIVPTLLVLLLYCGAGCFAIEAVREGHCGDFHACDGHVRDVFKDFVCDDCECGDCEIGDCECGNCDCGNCDGCDCRC